MKTCNNLRLWLRHSPGSSPSAECLLKGTTPQDTWKVPFSSSFWWHRSLRGLRCPRWISSQLLALPCRTIPPTRALLRPALFKCTLTLTPPYPTLLASAQNRRSAVGTRVAFGLIIKTESRNLLSLGAGALFLSPPPPSETQRIVLFQNGCCFPLPSAILMLSHV